MKSKTRVSNSKTGLLDRTGTNVPAPWAGTLLLSLDVEASVVVVELLPLPLPADPVELMD
jgi:hypothetical protein